MCKKPILCLVISLFFLNPVYADRRPYVWTYEYMTMLKERWELEHYLTTQIPHLDKSNINTIKQYIELEYGITDNWDIAVYQRWKYKNKKAESDSEYDGFKIRTRYKFGKKGQFIVDPLIYLEYIRDDDLGEPNVIEAKLILGKDIGKFNVSYNQILKRNLDREGKTEHEYAFALGYAVTSWFKTGIETKGNYSEDKYYLGPTISFAHKKFWTTLGAAFGTRNKKSDDLQIRMIVGWLF